MTKTKFILFLVWVTFLFLIIKLIYDIFTKENAQELINILETTAKLHLFAGILLSIGLTAGV